MPFSSLQLSARLRAASGPHRADLAQHSQAGSNRKVYICTNVSQTAKIECGIMEHQVSSNWTQKCPSNA